MLPVLPTYLSTIFILSVFLTLYLFYRVLSRSTLAPKTISKILYGLLVWVMLQVLLARLDVYNAHLEALPPKILVFGIAPLILTIVLLFVLPKGRAALDQLTLLDLHYLHIVRIPVEIGLYFLALHKAIPNIMTFEGQNFDILVGITAPLVAYFGISKAKMNRTSLLIWNLVSLVLLFNIVVLAFLAAPTPLQQIAFDQPNRAVFYYPFSLLPTFIVPVVLFCQLVSIRKLIKMRP